MKSLAPCLTALLLGFALVAQAEDTDPGYGDGRRVFIPRGGGYGPREYDYSAVGSSGLKPLYYQPTMRYYGNGYTVSYRYMPVYKQDNLFDGALRGSSNFRTEAFHIATDEIPSWGVNPPRLTVKDPRSAAPRSAVTSIVPSKRSKTLKRTTKPADTDTPAILPPTTTAAPATTGAAAPAPAPAPAVDSTAPAPAKP
jgi:hypothetical protein